MMLVLLPGMDGTGALFTPLLDALPPDARTTVVRYPDRPANYRDHELIARRELPRDEPFVLLGESFSGPVAVAIAAAPPPNLRGIILCASFLTSPHRLLRPLRALIPLASPKLLPRPWAHSSLLGPFATPALRAALADALRQVSSPTLTARLRAMADVDVRARFTDVTVPSLYLHATEDRVVAPRFAHEFAVHARAGTVAEVTGPHLLLQANPRDAATRILRFIASV